LIDSKRINVTDRFFDTNILLYTLSGDAHKADWVEGALADGANISVQVLNEFVSVTLLKFKMKITEVREAPKSISSVCCVTPITLNTHQRGLEVVERYQLSFYDALIVASALESGCTIRFLFRIGGASTFEQSLVTLMSKGF
jgi:predicted nucleic acid-binding protein